MTWCGTLREFLKYLSRDEVSSMLLMKVMVSRDELTVIHRAMVEQIAEGFKLSDPQTARASGGKLWLCHVVEVAENQDKIPDFVSRLPDF